MNNPLNESEFTQEELENYNREQQLKKEEVTAAEELLKNKTIEEWKTWRSNPYTEKLIDKLIDSRLNTLLDAERMASKKDANLHELIIEARTLRFVYDQLINSPIFPTKPQPSNNQ